MCYSARQITELDWVLFGRVTQLRAHSSRPTFPMVFLAQAKSMNPFTRHSIFEDRCSMGHAQPSQFPTSRFRPALEGLNSILRSHPLIQFRHYEIVVPSSCHQFYPNNGICVLNIGWVHVLVLGVHNRMYEPLFNGTRACGASLIHIGLSIQFRVQIIIRYHWQKIS